MNVLVLSPHYDDAGLSLGQSMRNGPLRRCRVTVGIVFGRSNWQRWFAPTRSRTPLVTAIRRVEEAHAALRFRYRFVTAPHEEAILRLGSTDTRNYLDPGIDAAADPVFDGVRRTIAGWAGDADLVLSPLGLGDHLDHRIVAAAARSLAIDDEVPTGFYEDRPYASTMGDEEIAAHVESFEPRLTRRPLSEPVNDEKHRRLFYPSQFDPFFTDAIRVDADLLRREQGWEFPAPDGIPLPT